MLSERCNVRLTLAINDSDQVRDVLSGAVAVDGIDLTCLTYPVEEIFFRFTRHREWEVSELSLAKYCSLRARGDTSVVGIPVFPSRSFRHAAIYVRPDGPVDRPTGLAGARIGFPEWTVTATVWARALLHSEYGIDLEAVRWVQGGVNAPGRVETLPVRPPPGIQITPEPSRTLNDMLLDGQIDAIIAPRAPSAFSDRSGRIVRLFSDPPAVERAYFEQTGVFPIMHLLVLRDDVHARYPWAAANLLRAFEQAKDRSLERLFDDTAPKFPLPWGRSYALDAEQVIGPDLWPYGIEANRTTLDAFLAMCAEQGVCERKLDVEELFPPSVRESFSV